MEIDQLLPDMHYFNGPLRWILQVFIVILFSLILDFIQKKIFLKFQIKLAKHSEKEKIWTPALFEALHSPLSLLIWIGGIAFAAEIVEMETHAAIFSAVSPLRKIGFIISLAWFFVRFVSRVEKKMVEAAKKKEKRLDQTTVDAVSKILRISFIITSILVALQSLGFSLSGVLAFGGVGGIAVGFAAKDLLANFFSAFMLYWDRPFQVGDWIRSPDREIEGTVEQIGWRLTKIRTFDKRPLYIPNSIFASISVENPSRMSHRRIYENLGVRYQDISFVPTILTNVREMLLSHPEIDQNQILMVNLNHFADSSLEFFIYTFTRTTDWAKFHVVKEDVLLKIHQIVESIGAEMAFPTTTLNLSDPILFKQVEAQIQAPEKISAVKGEKEKRDHLSIKST